MKPVSTPTIWPPDYYQMEAEARFAYLFTNWGKYWNWYVGELITKRFFPKLLLIYLPFK